jgi:OmpA-OmpF porin, OOP family
MRIASIPALIGLASLSFLMTTPPAAVAANAPGRAVVKPFPGAKAVEQSIRAFDEYWMPVGRLTGEAQAEKVETLGGKWSHIGYTTGAGRSVAEVFRHYEQQFATAGLQVVYACKGLECGEGGRKSNGDWWPLSDHRRFMAARLERPGGDLWVSVHVHARAANAPVQHELDVIEVKPPAIAPPVRNEADATTLVRELKADGRVVLHSLAFVEGKPTLMPASAGVVLAIAELLSRDPSLKLHVVVHSDDAAPAPASIDLTKKRASAVAQMLIRQHRIAPARVQPAGLGPLAPVASNRTAEGRATNRRVELVINQVAGGQAAAARR